VLAKAGIPIVFYLHGPITERSWLDEWAKRTQPAALIGVSRDTARTGQPLFPKAPVHVLPYPIPWASTGPDAAVRASVRAELGATEQDVVLLQASRADRWKGHDRLFDALGRLRDVPGWTLWLAGAAQRPKEVRFMTELRAQVERLGLAGRVKFLGERRDVPRLLQGADVYCQANVGPEGWSLSFMEAFAAARPIVTTRLGGAPELIDESTGILVSPGDAAAFAAALRRLIEHPAERVAMGEKARERVLSLCAPKKQLAELEGILASVVQHRPEPAERATSPSPLA
jgi:glycosyltransferase involved in cell wall biosynthesis